MSEVEDIFDLSPMQSGMLFDSLYSEDAGMHMIQLSYELGELDPECLERAWQAAVDHHAMMRASIHWRELEKPVQVVLRELPVAIDRADWSSHPRTTQRELLAQLLVDDRKRGFEFDAPPLFRLYLRDLGSQRFNFIWTFHHLLFEGWSASMVMQDVLAILQAELDGTTLELESPPVFRDYIHWIQQQETTGAEQFWKRELADFRTPTPLPVLGHNTSLAYQVEEYDVTVLDLSLDETAQLKACARRHQVTTNTVIQAAWALFLSHTSGESDVLFGTMVSGRSAPVAGIDRMIGLFINILPSRVRVTGDMQLSTWLQELQKSQVELRNYEHLPLANVKSWSEVPSSQPLFETLVVFENWAGDLSLKDSSGPIEVFDVLGTHGGPGLPLSLVVWPAEEMSFAITFDSKLYDHAVAEAMREQLGTLLRGLISEETTRLSELSLLTGAQERELVESWNQARAELPRETCIMELFEAEVARSPDATAVEFLDHSLSYDELNRRANALAHELRALGVRPESRIGICLGRSHDMVIAIWAVLKSGGAYVPLDPSFPKQRLAFMFEDANIEVLLTHEALVPKLPRSAEHVLCLDAETETAPGDNETNPERTANRDNLAFVTFTSGSTGQPKGSMVLHRGLLNAYVGWDHLYQLRDIRSHLVVASFAVDVFSADVIRCLCSGGRLVIAPHEAIFSPPRLCELLIEEEIEFAEFVPHVLSHVVAHLESTGRSLPVIKLLVVGSDIWLGSEWARARTVCNAQARLINAYGLNETSVDCTYFEDRAEDLPPRAYVPIGKPYLNHRVYVLNSEGRPVPRGVPGELFIGGTGIVRGYLNRPGITAERFLPDPFALSPGERMLKTGDRVRELADGNLEMLGRMDNQVKIRAYRVELGEIECAMQEHPLVRESVAQLIPDESGESQLVAHVVHEGALTAAELRQFLNERSPSYMVPNYFVFLDKFPLTANGLKVDRAALPKPDWSARPSLDSFVPPESKLERKLAEIWLEVLPVERIGAHDKFMDLGGNSLQLIPVLARAEKELEVRLLPGEMILSTLRQLAATAEQRKLELPEPAKPGFLSRVFGRD